MSHEREVVTVKKGDRFRWKEAVIVEVTRVSRTGEWADVMCHDQYAMWTKRQPLPFPSTFDLVKEKVVNEDALKVAGETA